MNDDFVLKIDTQTGQTWRLYRDDDYWEKIE